MCLNCLAATTFMARFGPDAWCLIQLGPTLSWVHIYIYIRIYIYICIYIYMYIYIYTVSYDIWWYLQVFVGSHVKRSLQPKWSWHRRAMGKHSKNQGYAMQPVCTLSLLVSCATELIWKTSTMKNKVHMHYLVWPPDPNTTFLSSWCTYLLITVNLWWTFTICFFPEGILFHPLVNNHLPCKNGDQLGVYHGIHPFSDTPRDSWLYQCYVYVTIYKCICI